MMRVPEGPQGGFTEGGCAFSSQQLALRGEIKYQIVKYFSLFKKGA